MKKYLLILSLSLISVLGFSQASTSDLQRTEIAAVKANSVVVISGATITTGTLNAVNNVTVNSIPAVNVATIVPVNVGTIVPVAILGNTISTAGRQVTEANKLDSAITQLIRANLLLVRNNNKWDSVINGNAVISTGGKTVKLSNTIATSSNTYASAQNIGGINTITGALRTSGGSGIIVDIVIWDLDNQSPNLIIDYWDASPSGTYTDHSAEVIAGDQAKWLGSISVSSGDFMTQGAISRAVLTGLSLSIKGNASANIFFTITTTSAPAYTGASKLVAKHGIAQD